MVAALRIAFGIPDNVAWLNAAARSPMPGRVAAAADAGLRHVRAPWKPDAAHDAATRVRRLAAELIGAAPDDMAIVGSVSAGMAVAARVLPVAPASRILLFAGEHPSAFLTWERLAAEREAVLDVVSPPSDGDWTAALEERLLAPGVPPLALVSLCPVNWVQGGVLDLNRLAEHVRRLEGALVVDATQSAGILPIDVAALQPDFLMFSTYKWLGGPYGAAMLYVAPRHRDAAPIEETMHGRDGLTMADSSPGSRPYKLSAERFDRGQRDDWVVVPAVEAALGFAREWRAEAVGRIRALMSLLRAGLEEQGHALGPAAHASPHIIGFRPGRAAASAVAAALVADEIFVSARLGMIRVSLHGYCSEQDVSRLLLAMRQAGSA